MYYIKNENNEIIIAENSLEQIQNALIFRPELQGVEILETEDGYTIKDFELVTDKQAEDIEIKKERDRLDTLFLTAADVERAIYKDKGIDFEDIIELVKDIPTIDIKALKIELKANNFYRGNPYVEAIGNILGFSSEDLDYLFINKEFPSEALKEVE